MTIFIPPQFLLSTCTIGDDSLKEVVEIAGTSYSHSTGVQENIGAGTHSIIIYKSTISFISYQTTQCKPSSKDDNCCTKLLNVVTPKETSSLQSPKDACTVHGSQTKIKLFLCYEVLCKETLALPLPDLDEFFFFKLLGY